MELDYTYFHDALDKVEHNTTVRAFYNQFHAIQSLFSFVHPEIPESYFSLRFSYRLQAEFQKFVLRFNPLTVTAAYHLSTIYEESTYLDYFPEDEVSFEPDNADEEHVDSPTMVYEVEDDILDKVEQHEEFVSSLTEVEEDVLIQNAYSICEETVQDIDSDSLIVIQHPDTQVSPVQTLNDVSDQETLVRNIVDAVKYLHLPEEGNGDEVPRQMISRLTIEPNTFGWEPSSLRGINHGIYILPVFLNKMQKDIVDLHGENFSYGWITLAGWPPPSTGSHFSDSFQAILDYEQPSMIMASLEIVFSRKCFDLVSRDTMCFDPGIIYISNKNRITLQIAVQLFDPGIIRNNYLCYASARADLNIGRVQMYHRVSEQRREQRYRILWNCRCNSSRVVEYTSLFRSAKAASLMGKFYEVPRSTVAIILEGQSTKSLHYIMHQFLFVQSFAVMRYIVIVSYLQVSWEPDPLLSVTPMLKATFFPVPATLYSVLNYLHSIPIVFEVTSSSSFTRAGACSLLYTNTKVSSTGLQIISKASITSFQMGTAIFAFIGHVCSGHLLRKLWKWLLYNFGVDATLTKIKKSGCPACLNVRVITCLTIYFSLGITYQYTGSPTHLVAHVLAFGEELLSLLRQLLSQRSIYCKSEISVAYHKDVDKWNHDYTHLWFSSQFDAIGLQRVHEIDEQNVYLVHYNSLYSEMLVMILRNFSVLQQELLADFDVYLQVAAVVKVYMRTPDRDPCPYLRGLLDSNHLLRLWTATHISGAILSIDIPSALHSTTCQVAIYHWVPEILFHAYKCPIPLCGKGDPTLTVHLVCPLGLVSENFCCRSVMPCIVHRWSHGHHGQSHIFGCLHSEGVFHNSPLLLEDGEQQFLQVLPYWMERYKFNSKQNLNSIVVSLIFRLPVPTSVALLEYNWWLKCNVFHRVDRLVVTGCFQVHFLHVWNLSYIFAAAKILLHTAGSFIQIQWLIAWAFAMRFLTSCSYSYFYMQCFLYSYHMVIRDASRVDILATHRGIPFPIADEPIYGQISRAILTSFLFVASVFWSITGGSSLSLGQIGELIRVYQDRKRLGTNVAGVTAQLVYICAGLCAAGGIVVVFIWRIAWMNVSPTTAG